MPEMRPNDLTFSESSSNCDHCQARCKFAEVNSIKVDIDHLMHELSCHGGLLDSSNNCSIMIRYQHTVQIQNILCELYTSSAWKNKQGGHMIRHFITLWELRRNDHFCLIMSKIFGFFPSKVETIWFPYTARQHFWYVNKHTKVHTFWSIATFIFLNIVSYLELLYFGVFDKFCRFPSRTSIPGFFVCLSLATSTTSLISVASMRSQILVKRSAFKWITFCWTGLRLGHLFSTSYWSKSRVEFL